jgi:hypothetical protein
MVTAAFSFWQFGITIPKGIPTPEFPDPSPEPEESKPVFKQSTRPKIAAGFFRNQEVFPF